MKTITITLRASHFKNTQFAHNKCGCAIEKSAMKLFRLPRTKVLEGISCISINHKWYRHEPYMEKDFMADMAIARKHGFTNKVIRKIQLTNAQ